MGCCSAAPCYNRGRAGTNASSPPRARHNAFITEGAEGVITGVQMPEVLQLVCVLLVVFFVLAGIYVMQKYTGV